MLIKCPECGKEISDKSIQCIHCGYPLSMQEKDNHENEFYKIVLEKIDINHKILLIAFIRNITKLGLAEAKKAVENLPYIIQSGLSYEECEKIQDVCKTYYATASIKNDNESKEHNEILKDVDIDSLKNPKYKPTNNTKPQCPKCGSTQIQMVPRKWSLLTGFATNKTDRVCVSCKYRW